MKMIGLIVAAAVAGLTAQAQGQTKLPTALRLEDGSTLVHPIFSRFDGQVFILEHDGGIARVPWAIMPPPFRYELAPDVDRAREENRQQVAASDSKRRAALLQSLNVHSIKEVESNLPGFTGKRFSFQGTIQVSSYYNYGYSEAQGTHYAFRVKDGTGDATVYVPKAQGEALRVRLLNGGGAPPTVFTCILLPERMKDRQGSVLAELLAYAE